MALIPPVPDHPNFTSPPGKLTIVAIDEPQGKVTAQYNPTELSVDKSIPWNKHKNPKGNVPMLEFTNAENRTMSMDLFFDAFSYRDNTVYQDGDVRHKIEGLTKLTMIKESGPESERHPPRVLVVFGMGVWFRGVITSLKIKYTMFRSNGIPVRATCSISIKEVDAVQLGGQE